ncbi:aldo/keto reductase [Gordoniibacillus kamchatkensis]|uniref:aldo/keto reductase n=1 Tax=Gordoniibacillus kamchatkensis TaxID=1590651 RepID=UPI0006987688|nr:aldo/keto reductase [Paenibacillus sp. VKM B-2647]
MDTWSKDELYRITDADDLHISPFREDGETYGTPTWIWSVVVDNALYVRAYYGQNSRWYQAALRQKAGRTTVAGMTKDVAFEPVDGQINDLIDHAYRAKYNGSPYLNSMISTRARSATVKVCQKNDILVEAYSPIAHGAVLDNAEVKVIADKYGVSVAQLCLRYDIQLGLVVIPKTTNPDHMRNNAELDFVISDADMETLNNVEHIRNYGEHSFFPVLAGN